MVAQVIGVSWEEDFVDCLGEVAAAAAAVEDVVEIEAGEIDLAWEAGGSANCCSTDHRDWAAMVAVVVVAMGSMRLGQSTERSLGSWEGIVVDSREGNCIDLACSLCYSIYYMK